MNSLPKWVVHDIMHFIVALAVLILIYLTQPSESYSNNLKYLVISVIVGAFIPDIDHLAYLRTYKFRSFGDFIKKNIKSDRVRRGFLIFHNVFFVSLLMFIIPLVYLFNPILSYFFLAFLSHLILDFLDDKLLIHTIEHWRSVRKFIKPSK